jgi:hypothetical protein
VCSIGPFIKDFILPPLFHAAGKIFIWPQPWMDINVEMLGLEISTAFE